jgi:tetratricopeptide (TPR) repeat protein
MLGRFEESRALLAELRVELVERGAGHVLAAFESFRAAVEFLAGDLAAAAEAGEESCRLQEQFGRLSELSTSAGSLAQVYYELGELEKAEAWAMRAADLGADEDLATQLVWRQARAKILAKRGEHLEAERLAREAVAIGAETDMLNAQGEAAADLGEVLARAGRTEEAIGAFEQALERYERKENLVMAARIRERLASVRAEVG